jgi:hypothetical protein
MPSCEVVSRSHVFESSHYGLRALRVQGLTDEYKLSMVMNHNAGCESCPKYVCMASTGIVSGTNYVAASCQEIISSSKLH